VSGKDRLHQEFVHSSMSPKFANDRGALRHQPTGPRLAPA
jgi:hypothetical protein